MKTSIQHQALNTLMIAILTVSSFAQSQEVSQEKEVKKQVDPSSYRLISSPSAIPGENDFSGNVHVHTFLGFAYTLGAALRWTKSLNEMVHVGIGSNVGMMFTPIVGTVPLFYGAGPVVSIGKENAFMNVSALYYGAHADDHDAGLFLPSVGGSYKIKEIVRLHGEVLVPITTQKYESVRFGALLYGVRVGHRVYADVNFIAPFGGDTAGVYRFFPLGFPIISAGVGF